MRLEQLVEERRRPRKNPRGEMLHARELVLEQAGEALGSCAIELELPRCEHAGSETFRLENAVLRCLGCHGRSFYALCATLCTVAGVAAYVEEIQTALRVRAARWLESGSEARRSSGGSSEVSRASTHRSRHARSGGPLRFRAAFAS